MRLFVAIESLEEEGDFSSTIPGELVHFPPVVCDCRDCGCERAMVGFASRHATTCFVARDIDIDTAGYTNLVFDTLAEAGWITRGSTEDGEWVAAWALEHIEMAADFPTETPLLIRKDRVEVRSALNAP